MRLGLLVCVLVCVPILACTPTRARVVAAPVAPPGAVTEGDPAAGVFDRGITVAALGSVDVQSCKRPGGPVGTGHIVVLFLPDGTAGDAVLDDQLIEDLNPFIGTPTGECIVERFKAARTKPFAGRAVRVGKAVHIQ